MSQFLRFLDSSFSSEDELHRYLADAWGIGGGNETEIGFFPPADGPRGHRWITRSVHRCFFPPPRNGGQWVFPNMVLRSSGHRSRGLACAPPCSGEASRRCVVLALFLGCQLAFFLRLLVARSTMSLAHWLRSRWRLGCLVTCDLSMSQ